LIWLTVESVNCFINPPRLRFTFALGEQRSNGGNIRDPTILLSPIAFVTLKSSGKLSAGDACIEEPFMSLTTSGLHDFPFNL